MKVVNMAAKKKKVEEVPVIEPVVTEVKDSRWESAKIECSNILEQIAVQDIISDFNIRSVFDEEAMIKLIENVRINDIIEPLIVNRVDGKYHLISGSRRLNAAIVLEKKTVPCIVHDDLNDVSVHSIMISENLLREELDPIAEAVGIQRLVDDGVTQEEIGKGICKSQEYVSNRTRLLKLHPLIQARIISREIKPSDGLGILGEISKIRAIQLFDNDAFIDSCSVSFSSKKNYDDAYDYGRVFVERAVAVYKKNVVTDPRFKLSWDRESSNCYGCEKCHRDVCSDPSCFAALMEQKNNRSKSSSKKEKKVKTSEEIALEENLSLFYSELREKAAMLSLERKLEMIATMAFRRMGDQELERSMKLAYGDKKFKVDTLEKQFQKIDALFVTYVLNSCCYAYSMSNVNFSPTGFANLVKDTGIAFSKGLLNFSGAEDLLKETSDVVSEEVVEATDDGSEEGIDEDIEIDEEWCE
jgi:ParB-like partition proteins